MENTLMNLPENISNELLPLKAEAMAMVITTPEQKQRVGQMFIATAIWEKAVKSYFEPMKSAANATHKAITSKEREQLDRAKELKAIMAPKLEAYTKKEERERAEAEAKAIDQNKKNLAKAAEKADKLCKDGKQEQAAEVLANVKVADVKVPEPTKIDGLNMAQDYDITIVDIALIPREYLIPDEALIKKEIKFHKGKRQIPGITFKSVLKPRRTGRY